MGLPIWRAPSPTASKDAIKADVTASARSPIRRRARGSTPTIAVGSRRVRRSGNAHATLSTAQPSPRLDDNDFASSTSRSRLPPSHSRIRVAPPPVPESRHYSRPSVAETNENRESQSLTSESAYGDAHPERAMGRPNPAFQRFASEAFRRPSSIWEYGFPLFPRDTYRNSSYTFGDLPSLTPNFAPASSGRLFGPHSPERRDLSTGPTPPSRVRPGRTGLRRDLLRSEDLLIIDDGDDTSNDNNAVGFPPLQRIGRRAIADGPLPSSSLRESWSPATTLDGLGDRERSLSPTREHGFSVNDDHWDAMLSTVTPDPIAPSAHSSFASAAASASFSNSNTSSRAGSANSNSVSSSNTHLTVPSRHDDYIARICDTSDDDSHPSDTEVEGDEPQPVHTRRVRGMPWRRTPLPEPLPPLRNPARYSRSIRDRSLDSTRFVRNHYASALRPNPETELSSNDETSPNEDHDGLSFDSELQEARAILERLVSRRGDLTDELWTSIGLTPSLAERIERLQQRERL